jgi:uncharacterized protein (TIGR02466 family)
MLRQFFFPITIYERVLGNKDKINSELIKNILEWKTKSPESLVRSNTLGWHSECNMHEKEEYKDLLHEIKESLINIHYQEGYSQKKDMVIVGMWANVSPKYSYNKYHVHPPNFLSGVYYAQTPKNCGEIVFENRSDPRYYGWQSTIEYENSAQQHQWDSINYKAEAGKLLIFPSWLGHHVEQNLTDLEGEDSFRISISFNVDWYN